MLRSVRIGGFAAALLSTLCGAHPARAQVNETAAAPVLVLTPAIAAAPAASEPPARAIAPILAGQRSLQDLTREYAGAELSDADHECLATAVYFEARGEPLDGQLAVAEVVLNRAASGRYPRDVCAVVKQPWQFSFVRKGQFPPADRASTAWRRAIAIAKVAQDKLATALPRNVLWYHADYVAPSWGKRLTRKAKIGAHIFYS